MRKILIVDDERTARKGLVFTLRPIIDQIEEAASKEEAEQVLKDQEFDLVVVDLRLPNEEQGLDLIGSIRRMYPLTPVLVITAYGSVNSAVRAMKAGAEDYITKDFNREEIILKIEKILETRRLWLANFRLAEQVSNLKKKYDQFLAVDQIIGGSTSIRQILDIVERVGKDNDSTVLITGESGTGKELIARSIHFKSPLRSPRSFVVVDVANMPSSLLESQLFGHEKGAFTNAHQQHIGLVELANGGTIFLDEIGDFPLKLQMKLLRFLQDKTFTRVGGSKPLYSDVRIIAATNKDLEEMVQKQRFREDLYYRLNVVRIHLPPLRERREDIRPLIRYFQKKLEVQKNKKLIFRESLIQKMVAYDWPGNIRQLRNMIESLYVVCPEGEVRETDINFNATTAADREEPLFSSLFRLPFKEARQKLIEKFETAFLKHYFQMYQGNISRIATQVGESRESLSKKMKRYGIKNS